MPRIHQLTEQILAESGALADATIIAAARSTKHNQAPGGEAHRLAPWPEGARRYREVRHRS